MRIIFLGTGTGIPEKNNSSSSILIEINNRKFVFDFGEGLMKNIVRKNISINDIDALFLTHFHVDHISGIVPMLFAFRYPADLRKKDFYIFGPEGTNVFFKKLFKIFKEQIKPESYRLFIRELKPGKTFYFKKIKIKTFKTKHRKESMGYIIYEKGKKIIYTGDTDYDEGYKKIFRNAELLITECSVPVDIKGHMNPDKIVKLCKNINVKKIALIHLYPVLNKNKLKKFFKENLKTEFEIPSELYEIII